MGALLGSDRTEWNRVFSWLFFKRARGRGGQSGRRSQFRPVSLNEGHFCYCLPDLGICCIGSKGAAQANWPLAGHSPRPCPLSDCSRWLQEFCGRRICYCRSYRKCPALGFSLRSPITGVSVVNSRSMLSKPRNSLLPCSTLMVDMAAFLSAPQILPQSETLCSATSISV